VDNKADWFKIVSGYVLGSAAFAFCVYAGWTRDAQPVIGVLLCILGGVLGWVIGIVVTPLNEGEKRQFSDYAKAVSTLISGYVLAKAGDIAQGALTEAATTSSESLFLRFLLFSSCLLIGTLFTFIGRRYVRGSEEEQRARRAKALAEVQEALAKLSALH
jgi:hypothetical protein